MTRLEGRVRRFCVAICVAFALLARQLLGVAAEMAADWR